VHPDVLAAMLPYFREHAGNPASVHAAGRRARRAVEEARENVAAAVDARPRQVVFTSGATEALHLAVRGFLAGRPGAHLVSCVSEHAAVLERDPGERARRAPVTWLRPEGVGARADRGRRRGAEARHRPGRADAHNNETGVRHDLAPLRARIDELGARVVVDAVQAFGYERCSLSALGADMMALSSHKVEGPKGCGALVLAEGVALEPQQPGGGQERGLRGGTVDVPAVVGFGVAARPQRVVERALGAHAAAARPLRGGAERNCRACASTAPPHRAGPSTPTCASTTVDGETLLINLDALGVLASAGSACAAGSVEPSHVLLAMGLSRAAARASVRFSFGDGLDERLVGEAVRRVSVALRRSRGEPDGA
jgi:cysteine desulfurase